MKRLTSILMIAMVAMACVFTSCSKDDENSTLSMSFKGGETYTSTDVTILVDKPILVGITAESSVKLENFTLTITANNISQLVADSALNEKTFSWESYISFPAACEARLLAKVTDKDGFSEELSFNITVEGVAAGLPVVKYNDVLLGSHNDTNGSFFSASNSNTYTISGAAENQALIDMIFFYGENMGYSLAAPADPLFLTNFAALGVANWTTKNMTFFFQSNMTAEEFDAIGETFAFEMPDFTTATLNINNLQVNQVVMFANQSGLVGFAKAQDLRLRGNQGVFDFVIANYNAR